MKKKKGSQKPTTEKDIELTIRMARLNMAGPITDSQLRDIIK